MNRYGLAACVLFLAIIAGILIDDFNAKPEKIVIPTPDPQVIARYDAEWKAMDTICEDHVTIKVQQTRNSLSYIPVPGANGGWKTC